MNDTKLLGFVTVLDFLFIECKLDQQNNANSTRKVSNRFCSLVQKLKSETEPYLFIFYHIYLQLLQFPIYLLGRIFNINNFDLFQRRESICSARLPKFKR